MVFAKGEKGMAYSDYKMENSEPIGNGGNANVYLAKDVKTGSMVALKELKTGGRFFEEKRQVLHRNVIITTS